MLLKNEKEDKKKRFPAYVNDDWRSYFHRRSYISSYSLLVDAVYGELILEPVVDSVDRAKKMMEHLLKLEADYLPEFH